MPLRIQLQLLAVLATLVLVVALGASWFAERSLRERELARLEQSLTARAGLVAQLIEANEGTDRAALQRLAERAGTAGDARVTLIGRDGRVTADSHVPASAVHMMDDHGARPEVAAALSGQVGHEVRYSRTIRRELMYVAIPSPIHPGEVIRVSSGLEAVDAQVAAIRHELVAAGLLGLLVAAVLSYAIAWLTLRPVRQLSDEVAGIATGRPERRLPGRHPLGRAAESMMASVQQMHARLGRATAEKTQLEAVLTNMVEGVLVLDAGGRITLANPRLQELLDVWDDPLGLRPIDLVRNAALHDALAAAESRQEPVVRDIELDGKEARSLLMHAVALPASDGGGVVAVFHDVSEIRRLDRVRRDFLANASHELRTPLTSIQGFATTLLESNLSPDERKNYLEVVVRNAGRLSTLIDDLLELSKIEGRRDLLRPTEVDVTKLIAMQLEDLAPRISKKDISASTDMPAEAIAWADRRAVEQVLTNLLDNAVKYSDPGSEIRVTVSPPKDGRVAVAVQDSGVGIPAEDVDRIFERFYRVDKARSRALGGTGLGLSIVKHLVQGMGGEIGVRSQPGGGSTFYFWLPTRPRDDD